MADNLNKLTSDLKFLFKDTRLTTARCVTAAMFASKIQLHVSPGEGWSQTAPPLSFCTSEQKEARALNTLIEGKVLPRVSHQGFECAYLLFNH